MKEDKLTKKLKQLSIILIIIIIICVSFFGIMRKNLNKWENIVPDYKFSKEIDGTRSFSFKIDDSTKEISVPKKEENKEEETKTDTENADDTVEVNETVNSDGTTTSDSTENKEETTEEAKEESETQTVPVNSESNLNKDNYNKSKKVIEKRLQLFGIDDYKIRLDEKNGNIEVEVPYEDETQRVIDLIENEGKIEIIDSDTNEVLLNNSDIKEVVAYSAPSSQTSTVAINQNSIDFNLQITFNKEGLKKFQNITKKYVKTVNSTDTNTENKTEDQTADQSTTDTSSEDDNSTIKSVTIKVNDAEKYKTYFSLEGNYTTLSFPLFSGVTDEEVAKEYNKQSIIIQDCINSGKIPVIYKLDSGLYLETDNKTELIKIAVISMIVAITVTSIIFILKNKKYGLFAILLEVGYIASLLLIIRLAEVQLSLTGIVSILISSLMNYYFIYLMTTEKSNKYLSAASKFVLSTVPLIIMTIVFNFSNTIQLKSMGMVFFWGFLITFVYNAIFSNYLLNSKEKEVKKGAGK